MPASPKVRYTYEDYLVIPDDSLWIVDADENAIEVWRSGEEPRIISSGAIDWRVGDRRFRIAVDEIFRV